MQLTRRYLCGEVHELWLRIREKLLCQKEVSKFSYRADLSCAIHVHDHQVGTCEKCGSAPVLQVFEGGKTFPGMYKKVGTDAKNLGTKDTHINFGEYLDDRDWREAEKHCGKSDLVIVAGIHQFLTCYLLTKELR